MHLDTTGILQADGCTSTHAFIGCSSASELADLVLLKKKDSIPLCSTGK